MGKSGVRPAQCRYCIRAANRAGVRKPASCICATYLRAKGGGLWSRRRNVTPLPKCGKGVFRYASARSRSGMRRGTATMHCPQTARRVVASMALAFGVLLGPAAIAAPAGAHAAVATITVMDDHHTRVVLHGGPRRIVALAPNGVEILHPLDVGKPVVGVSQDSD